MWSRTRMQEGGEGQAETWTCTQQNKHIRAKGKIVTLVGVFFHALKEN